MEYTPLHCELVSWNRVYQLTHALALQIKNCGFRPDLIVAVARGGYVPARLLCDFLHVYELAGIRVEHYSKGARKHKSARLKYPLALDPSGMRVLIVDDICDTGETYRVVLEHMFEFSPHEIRTAALQHKRESGYEPDFIARRLRKWRWLIYPWALTEDVCGFIEQMQDRPNTLERMRSRLHEDYGIRLSTQRLRGILEFAGEWEGETVLKGAAKKAG